MADFTIKQGDTSPSLTDTLTYSDGTTVNLTGASVNIVVRQLTSNSVSFNKSATVTSATAPATVSYTFTAADTTAAGQYVANWIVVFAGGAQMTFPTIGELEITVEENLTTPGGARIVGLGEIKDYLNIPATDRSRDAKILRLSDGLTRVVEAITGPILQRQYNETYDVRHRPIISVQSVVEYRGPIPYNLTQVTTPDTATIYSYTFEPAGRIVRRTVGGGLSPFPPGANQVYVNYTAGFQQVPQNVRDGMLELIRVNYRDTQQGRPRAGSGGSDVNDDDLKGTVMMGFLIPNRVREYLEPNRRHPSIA
jgi:hypothetical protein